MGLVSRRLNYCLALVPALGVLHTAPAEASCGGAYQRMQVGVLPDVFLNHASIRILRGGGTKGSGSLFEINPPIFHLPPFEGAISWVERRKVLDYFWTGNLDLPGKGDCDVYARVTVRGVGVGQSYSACYPDNLGSCIVKMYPAPAVVGPAIAENVVKKWSFPVVANSSVPSGTIGAIELFGLDCQGDICEPPPCLQLEEEQADEFYVPPPPECVNFGGEGWESTQPGQGSAYLIGRGNLYIGPRDQPAFGLEATSRTPSLGIDHWIANDNPQAIILVTPKGAHSGASRYYGVQYNPMTRRWSIVAERDAAAIEAGSAFSVYVMGDRGPGLRVSSAAGGDRLWVDDPLVNDNPNAILVVTRLVDDECYLAGDSGKLQDGPGPILLPPGNASSQWVCNKGYFDHPVAVEYEPNVGRWAIVSADGTSFPTPVAFNVFVSGLAGKYRSGDWIVGSEPDYAGRLEASSALPVGATMALPDFDFDDPAGVVLITNNLTPNGMSSIVPNEHPAGAVHDGTSWTVQNLDGAAMAASAYNVVAPLRAP